MLGLRCDADKDRCGVGVTGSHPAHVIHPRRAATHGNGEWAPRAPRARGNAARPSDIPPAWAALWKRPADGQALRATNVLVGIVAEVSRDGGKANMLPGVQREAPVHKRHGGARRVSRASTCWGFTFLLGLRLPANLVSPGEPRAHRWCGPSDLPASGTLPHTHRGKCGSSRGYSACARRWRDFLGD